jgi:hypothetical protein
LVVQSIKKGKILKGESLGNNRLVTVNADNEVKITLSVLRAIANVIAERKFLTPFELEQAKRIAAETYLSHTNREIDLKNPDFQMIVDILRHDIGPNVEPNY